MSAFRETNQKLCLYFIIKSIMIREKFGSKIDKSDLIDNLENYICYSEKM